MHYELEITVNNEYFNVNVNYNIITYLRQFNTTNECWYDFTPSENDINNLKQLSETTEEKEFINKITENTNVDILEHFIF